MTDSDFTDSWSPDLWRKALRSCEDSAATSLRTILELDAVMAELVEVLEAAQQRLPTHEANRARAAIANSRAERARRLKANGMTVGAIAKKLDVTSRHVNRLLNRPPLT